MLSVLLLLLKFLSLFLLLYLSLALISADAIQDFEEVA